MTSPGKVVALACAVSAIASAATADPAAFVGKHCNACHNASVASGGIDFTSLPPANTLTANREVWERALAKLKAGEMPPPGMPKPPAADMPR